MPLNREEWQKWTDLFRNAEDKTLDALHERFFKMLGYEVRPVKVYDTALAKVIIPEIGFVKDELIKKRILMLKNVRTILQIGFWDTRFIFNLGLGHGFYVDGLDCYKKAVDVANESLSTLPPKIAARFKFYYGLAENLLRLPQYDVIVNICLEHTRDPELVVANNLNHVKPNGVFYIAVPIRHGCDSPNHLHHFQEPDLHALLPKGYKAKIFSERFQESSPRVNYFVVEVTRR